MIKDNPICGDGDSYKVTHWKQYPQGTEALFGYLESRGGEFDRTVFFGLQYILKEYFQKKITREDVEQAKTLFKAQFGDDTLFNEAGWMRVVNMHGGNLPLRIRAVQEGSIVPTQNVLMTVETTDKELFWLTTWFEAQLMRVWYPITVATISHRAREIIWKYLLETTTEVEAQAQIRTKLHDFGARGVSSAESAGIGGAAHLLNFVGSDTIRGVAFAMDYYSPRSDLLEMPSRSIPASEHSTMTSWGHLSEEAAYKNMLEQFGRPGKIFAVVSDSYNIYHAVENIWGGSLKEAVIRSGATLVIRPDSGDPVTVVTQLLCLLEKQLGVDINKKGFKTLKHNVRLIQGDGVNLGSIEEILIALKTNHFSAENIAFGMGGALLQKLDRDTQKFAFKVSSVTVHGSNRDVFKQPIDDGAKASKRGRLDLVREGDTYKTVVVQPGETRADSALHVVYEDGKILVHDDMDAIRARLWPAVKSVKFPH